MARKLNFLVMVMISVIFALIVNATEEVNGTYNQSNDNSSYNTATSELGVLATETSDLGNFDGPYEKQALESTSVEVLTPTKDQSQTVVIENKEIGKSVTTSFGVYLTIVG